MTSLAAFLAAGVLLPDASLGAHFALIDHDDSVHPFTPAQLGAVRALLGLGAALLGGIAVLLAAKRRRAAQFRRTHPCSSVDPNRTPPGFINSRRWSNTADFVSMFPGKQCSR